MISQYRRTKESGKKDEQYKQKTTFEMKYTNTNEKQSVNLHEMLNEYSVVRYV
jgi:hypothetical protein